MFIANTKTIAKLFNVTCDNVNFSGISINSKKCRNNLFIAIIGNKFNAHKFVQEAKKNGAKAIIASEKITLDLPIIYVKNTTKALGVIAKYHRLQMPAKVIAITGSNGKTTTKNMLFNILQQVAPTLKTSGNLNNHIGVPLTLLNLTLQHKFAIIEMGANHVREIAYLRDIAKPDMAIVINTLDAHIGEFGGFANLVKTKNEIFGVNSLNIASITNPFKTKTKFGDNTNIFASNINNNIFLLNIDRRQIEVNLQLLGKHNIENALAASACADKFNIKLAVIKNGIEKTTAAKSRLELKKIGAITIIDDSYNASFSSTKYALEVLDNFNGIKVAVLGEIGETGDKSHEIHAKIGKLAKKLNIDYIYSIGNIAKQYGVLHFTSAEQLITKLQQYSSATILFKGSRSAKLENIIKALLKLITRQQNILK